MPSFDKKQFLPHVLLIIGFALVSLFYSYPSLQGKKLVNGDNVQWQCMAHEGMTYHDSTGKDVLWSNSMFGGMPTYTEYVAAIVHNYPANLQDIPEALGKPAYFFFIAMLCFYILMIALDVDSWLGAIGALAFAFSTYNVAIIVGGHETEMLSIGYAPAILAGAILLYRGRWLAGAAIMGISLSLTVANSHYQICYYILIMVACLVVSKFIIAIKESKLKDFLIASGIAVVTAILAIGPNLSVLLATNEYAKATMRGGQSELSSHDKGKTSGGLDKDYAFLWSNSIGETFCILVPGLYGGSSDEKAGTNSATYDRLTKMGVPDEQAAQFCDRLPLYWGPQPFLGGPVYFGAIICFLFVLGLITVKNPNKWWIVVACGIGIVMSWGKHFAAINYFLFDHLPMLNKFRTPSMILVIPEILFPVLGVWGVNEILKGKLSDDEVWKKVKMSVIITAGLCLLLGIGGRAFLDFRSENDQKTEARYAAMLGNNQDAAHQLMKAIQDDRASLATNSGLKSAIFIILAGGLFWAYSKKKVKAPMLLGGLAILVVIDLVSIDWRYLNDEAYVDASDYEANFQPRPVDQAILRDKDPYYRVLDLSTDPYNDAKQAYFHKCIGGYSPAKMEIYQDLIDRQMNGRFNGQVLNMLNTKYIIVGGQKGNPQVLPNPEACGNAWFVDEIKWANTADDEMNGLNAPFLGDTTKVPNAFNPKKTAIVRETFKNDIGNYQFGRDSSAYVKLAQYGLDDISFTSSNSKDGFAVFSDIYYDKGWKAYVDGKETPIIRANYVLRAIKVPAGRHNIEFHFRPQTFYKATTYALISSILLFALVLGSLVSLFMKPKKAS